MLTCIPNQVNMLQQLHHPNIIQLREVFYHKKKIYMCMTLCTGACASAHFYVDSLLACLIKQRFVDTRNFSIRFSYKCKFDQSSPLTLSE